MKSSWNFEMIRRGREKRKSAEKFCNSIHFPHEGERTRAAGPPRAVCRHEFPNFISIHADQISRGKRKASQMSHVKNWNKLINSEANPIFYKKSNLIIRNTITVGIPVFIMTGQASINFHSEYPPRRNKCLMVSSLFRRFQKLGGLGIKEELTGRKGWWWASQNV